jgi:hypothetical protein
MESLSRAASWWKYSAAIDYYEARAIAEAGVRLEDADGVAEGMVRGEDAVFLVEAVGEPVAEAVGGDGAGFVGEGGRRGERPRCGRAPRRRGAAWRMAWLKICSERLGDKCDI